MPAATKFLNDVIKPWDELNRLLVQRYAFQPDLSDVTRLAQGLAVAIKHQVDIVGLDTGREPRDIQREANSDDGARIISDAADTRKHRVLGDPSRQAPIVVKALFEVSDQGFRFIRNSVTVEHASLGSCDFLAASLKAIDYWIKKLGLSILWRGSIAEAPAEFFPTAFLHYNPEYCIDMNSTRFQFVRRGAKGEIEPYDPKTVRVEIF